MMLVYQRYIILNILVPLLMVTFVVTGLVWITQVLKLLYLIDKGIRLSHFLHLVILVIPSLLFIVLPFVTVLAVIYAYNRLSEERQLIILKNSGLNDLRLATPALLVASLVALFSYYLAGSLMPSSYIRLKAGLSFIKENYASNIIPEKTFNQISKSVVIFVDKKLSNGELQGLVLFDNRNSEAPAIIFAKAGSFKINDNKPIFYLSQGSRQAYDNNGNLTKLYFDSLIVELTNYKAQTDDQAFIYRDINEYYISELLNPPSSLPPLRKIKLLAEGHQRLMWPLYSFVLTFMGLAVFLKQPYNKKSHFRQIFWTTTAIITVTYCHFTCQNLAARDLDFIYGSYGCIVVAMLFGVVLYRNRSI